MNCQFCDTVLMYDDPWTTPLYTEEGQPQPYHRECALRSVTGGIGHLIAHPYWCVQQGDPDAGLSYRHSALMVEKLVQLINVDAAIARFPSPHKEVDYVSEPDQPRP